MDLGARIRDLKDKANTYGSIAYNSGRSDYSDDYICTRCWYDTDGRGPEHGYFCDGFRTDPYADGYVYIDCFEEGYCGMEEQLERLEEISKLEAAAMWSATLDNPILAAGNSFFPAGLVKSPKFVAALLSSRPRARFSPCAVIANQVTQGLSTKIFARLAGLGTFVD